MDTLNIEAAVQEKVGLVNGFNVAYVTHFDGPDGRDGQIRASSFTQANEAANVLIGLTHSGVRIWSNLTHEWL